MVENQLFSLYSGGFDEVYGLNDYESFYYDAPQQPSYNRSDYYYCQTELAYNPAFYVMPSYYVYYSEMPVLYSAEYYYLTDFVQVYSGYYMPYCYGPTNFYYISDIYQVPSCETPLVYSSVEQNSFAYEEYDGGLFSPDNGFYNDSYESFEGAVGEASTTSHLFYEEGPEKLNGDPNDDEEESNSSNNRVNNDVVSSIPDKPESAAIQIDDGNQPCAVNTDRCEEDDVSFLESLSAADFMQLKAEIDGTYNQLKENLYNDVTKGYSNMKEFLKKVKWKWDRDLYTIREDEKKKIPFDMEQYYFHDVIRIPKGRVRYEDPSEKYILYQMLGSLEIDNLKRFMQLNYDNGKVRLYEKECKGYIKMKKQLHKLKWEPAPLCPIIDGVELKITKREFRRNFKRGLRNITSEESKNVYYLLDVLKKSVLTSTPESEECEEIQNVFTEEGSAPDCQLMKEHPQLSVYSSDSEEGEVSNTPDISQSEKELDVESQNVTEDLQLVEYSSCVTEDSEIDPVPQKTESSLNKEDSDIDIIAETNSSTSSLKEEAENEHPFVPPTVIEMDFFCKEISGVENIEKTQTSTSSREKVGENEGPFAPPAIELDSVSDVSFREEEHHAVSMSSTEQPNLDVCSPDKIEEKSSEPPSVILEPEALAAAAENKHPKKRFSSLRKFLSRICCCRKKPPS